MSQSLRRCWFVLALIPVLAGVVSGQVGPEQGQPEQDRPHNSLTDQERADGFVLLFDGRSLEGWTTSGNIDAWRVEEGEIRTTGRGGGWLRTQKQYRDFELRLDFNLPPQGNSGVGLRGSATGDPAFTGMEVQILDTHGQEPDVWTCGAVYNAIAPRETAVREAGQWNSYRIRLAGDTLNVWLNGVHILRDEELDERGFHRRPEQPLPLRDRLTTGYIALQDHGNPVRFRNIRLRDMSPDPDTGDWEDLFNGQDLTGWHSTGRGSWDVENGVLIGRDGPGHLFTDRTFADLEVRAHVWIGPRGNSGLYFRTVPNPDNPAAWPVGYEAQVDNHDPKNFTGCIYAKAWADELITRDGAWFDYRVRAVGPRIQTWINGRPMVDAELDEFFEGHVALQTHHRGNEVRWRDLQIRVLRESRPGRD